MRAILLLLMAPALFGQEFRTRLGTEAADIQGGIFYGHGNGRAENAIGGKIRGGLNRYFSLYGEYGYTRLISESTFSPKENTVRGSISEFGGGGEVHLSGGRIQPYALAGIGTARYSAKATVGSATVTLSTYRFASSLGGGVRFFVNRNFGFSAEAKTVWLPADNGRFERYMLGVFFQRGSR